MQPNEILVEVRIPAPGAGSGGAYEKFERKVGDYAVSAAAVQLTMRRRYLHGRHGSASPT